VDLLTDIMTGLGIVLDALITAAEWINILFGGGDY